MDNKLIAEALALLKESKYAVVVSVDADGYPRPRVLQIVRCEGLREMWFTTSNQSAKVVQFVNNSKASICISDYQNIRELTLVGTMEVLEDRESKQLAWQDGFEKFYPEGIETPWYCVLRFRALFGQYYHGRPYDFEFGVC